MISVGVIGLGEAGGAIVLGLTESGTARVVGFDVEPDRPAVRSLVERTGITLAGTSAELAEGCDLVLSLTSAKVAVAVARTTAVGLNAPTIYVDCNSASPRTKQSAAAVVALTGASFVDAALMAAVPPHRHQVPVLASGPGAVAFGEMAVALDMRVEVLGTEPGQASAVKMYRSLLVKGIEALVLECVLGAERHGAASRVLASMDNSLPFDDWDRLAGYLLGRTVVHAERRAEELRQVAATLVDSHIEPLMALAGAARLQWAANQELPERFGDSPPASYQEVLAALKNGSR